VKIVLTIGLYLGLIVVLASVLGWLASREPLADDWREDEF